MNAKEFMIGDWVRDAGRTDRPVYKRINRVDERENDCVADEYKVISAENVRMEIKYTPRPARLTQSPTGCQYRNRRKEA